MKRFRERLQQEFDSRKARNSKYSLRGFAAYLKEDHSSLAQMLRGTRPIPAARIRSWGKKLGLAPEETAVYIAAEHAGTIESSQRTAQLLHWTAEALAVMEEPAHFGILRLTRETGFQADTRWIARELKLAVDKVNEALTRLLRLHLLEMAEGGLWKELTGHPALTEAGVRRLALERVRQAAADQHIELFRGKKRTHE